MTAFVASRGLGLLRTSALAYRFDNGPDASAFVAAFRIPDLLFALVVGGALNSAFIPVFAGLLQGRKDEEAWRLASTVLNTVVLALAVLGGLAALAAPSLAPLLAPGFDAPTRRLVGELSRVLFLQPLFFGVGAVAFAILNARQHFLLPAWAPAVYNLFQLVALWLLVPRFGIMGLAVGVVAGAVAYAAMQLPTLRRYGFSYRPLLAWGDGGFRRVLHLLLPRTLSLASNQIGHTIATTVLASSIVGGVTALNYAYTLLLLPIGILGVSVSTVAFPAMSSMAGAGQLAQFSATLRSAFRALLYFGIGASALLLALRRPVVALLYQHGRFSAADAALVSWPLAFYAVGLFAHVADELLPRAFFALQDTRTPLIINLVAVAANVLLSLVLLRWLGLGGIALALTLAALFEMAIYLRLLERRTPGFMDASLRRHILLLLAAGALTWLAATIASGRIAGQAGTTSIGHDLAQLLAGGVAGAVVYLISAAAAGAKEHERVFTLVRGLTRRVTDC